MMIILICSLCAIGWVCKITKPGGIFAGLPAKCTWLPQTIFYPLFECAACNSFWWALAVNLYLYNHDSLLLLETILNPLATVGLTTIISHVTKIN